MLAQAYELWRMTGSGVKKHDGFVCLGSPYDFLPLPAPTRVFCHPGIDITTDHKKAQKTFYLLSSMFVPLMDQ
jgi:hypothetical protein